MSKEEARKVIEEANDKKPQNKGSGFAKNFTVFIVVAFFVIGVYASSNNAIVSMDKLIKFIESYSGVLITLLASIGIGTPVGKALDVVKNKHNLAAAAELLKLNTGDSANTQEEIKKDEQ